MLGSGQLNHCAGSSRQYILYLLLIVLDRTSWQQKVKSDISILQPCTEYMMDVIMIGLVLLFWGSHATYRPWNDTWNDTWKSRKPRWGMIKGPERTRAREREREKKERARERQRKSAKTRMRKYHSRGPRAKACRWSTLGKVESVRLIVDHEGYSWCFPRGPHLLFTNHYSLFSFHSWKLFRFFVVFSPRWLMIKAEHHRPRHEHEAMSQWIRSLIGQGRSERKGRERESGKQELRLSCGLGW